MSGAGLEEHWDQSTPVGFGNPAHRARHAGLSGLHCEPLCSRYSPGNGTPGYVLLMASWEDPPHGPGRRGRNRKTVEPELGGWVKACDDEGCLSLSTATGPVLTT